MAGNIVKWWKHKILGGYKQFTVLQECATDSEELIYPIRAPSSCSAPPDLLLTSSGGDHNEAINHRVSVSHSVPVTTAAVSSGKTVREQNIYQTHSYKEESGSERMHLEEFTCDISVEGGKSSQPLQFSFTFYDLDGHHGKITKDDIAGIVYTIYESIGKSVVVPHCGSKTINVRLTVSPDSKAKPTKISAVTPRRRRYKSKRHTANSDDENDVIHENTTTEMREPPLQMKSHLADSTNHQSLFATSTPTKGSDNSAVAKECFRSVELPCCIEAKTLLQENLKATNVCHPLNTTELQDNIYESIKNIKLKRTEQQRADVAVCRDCTSHQCAGGVEATATATAVVVPPVKLSTRKVLRKSRSRRHKTAGQSGCHERRRSLSVGNENCWRNVKEGSGSGGGAEDLKNHFKKDDLFDIIRESMEKNRLCFQSNGKTTSPSRHHRHRSQTISKIVDDREPSAPYHHHHNQQSSQPLTSPVISHTNSRPNWCGYDSFLHATLCSNNAHSPHAEHAIIPMPLNSATSLKTSHQINNTHNIKSSSSNNHHHQQQQINNGRCKTRHKSNDVAAMTASPQVQGYSKLMSSTCHQKVNAAILNALNPSQALELKLTRKMNHEKELLSLSKSNELRLNLGDELKSKCKDENVLNSTYVEKIRITEKLSDKFNDLQSKKRDNIKRSNKYQTKVVNQSEVVQNSLKSNGFVVEYASIPITVDPTECENLLKATSDDDAATTPDDVANTLTADNLSASAVHRYVHEHIHHHYHHFEGANVD